MKLNSWLETGLDGDVLLTPYVPKGITGYDDEYSSKSGFKIILGFIVFYTFCHNVIVFV